MDNVLRETSTDLSIEENFGHFLKIGKLSFFCFPVWVLIVAV